MGSTSDDFDTVIRRLISQAGKANYLKQAEEDMQPREADLITKLGERIPNNTELLAEHRRKEYHAVVKNGRIVIGEEKFYSPSMAAKSITGYHINGWHFWKAKDRINGEWKTIAAFRDYWSQVKEE